MSRHHTDVGNTTYIGLSSFLSRLYSLVDSPRVPQDETTSLSQDTVPCAAEVLVELVLFIGFGGVTEHVPVVLDGYTKLLPEGGVVLV